MVDLKQEDNVIQNAQYDLRKVQSALIRKFTGENNFEVEGSHVTRLANGTLKTLIGVDCEYSVSGNVEKRDLRLSVKYWEPVKKRVPPLLRRDARGREREYRDYLSLAGVSSIPKVYLIEEILKEQGLNEKEIKEFMEDLKIFNRAIVLGFVGNVSLNSALREKKDGEARKKTIEGVLESIVDFEAEATMRGPRNDGSHFDERPMEARAPDYMRAIRGLDKVNKLPEDITEMLEKCYAPIGNSYDNMKNPVVCHGDLNTSNIILGNKGEYYFIDPKLKWRNPTVDLGCLLSSPGVLLGPKEWEDLAQKFKLLGIRKTGAVSRLKWYYELAQKIADSVKRITKREVVKSSLGIDEDIEKSMLYFLYQQILHNSFRNLAIITEMDRLFPGMYRGNSYNDRAEMGENMLRSSDILVNQPERLGVTQEEAALYDSFRKLMEGESLGDLVRQRIKAHEKSGAIIQTRTYNPSQTLNTVKAG